MELPIWVVDAFAERAFEGNPAGIVIVQESLSEATMQGIAAEMKHAETAFVQQVSDGFHLRWFTPESEVDLCGHATLAAAYVLFMEHHASTEKAIHFHTLSGTLIARKIGDAIQLDFPEVPVITSPNFALPTLKKALGASPRYVAPTKMDVLIELESEQEVRSLKPDLALLKEIETRGFIVTTISSTPGFDFVSRFFAPRVGVDEDPVTGSAHCTLAGYWGSKLGRQDLIGYQASKRGGTVKVKLQGDRVLLLGQANTFLKGKITL